MIKWFLIWEDQYHNQIIILWFKKITDAWGSPAWHGAHVHCPWPNVFICLAVIFASMFWGHETVNTQKKGIEWINHHKMEITHQQYPKYQPTIVFIYFSNTTWILRIFGTVTSRCTRKLGPRPFHETCRSQIICPAVMSMFKRTIGPPS